MPPSDDDALVPATVALMPREFELDRQGLASLDEVRRFLIERIAILLARQPALLMSILYRIDVSEAKVQRVLQESAPDAIAPDLADLIIERQLQKVKWRARDA